MLIILFIYSRGKAFVTQHLKQVLKSVFKSRLKIKIKNLVLPYIITEIHEKIWAVLIYGNNSMF